MTNAVTLEPMTRERFVSWNEQLVIDYAQDKVDAGNWPAEGAVERSAADNARALPDGYDTKGHDFFIGVVNGQEIGYLWFFSDPALAVPETFIYDIEVTREQRGKGYGRGILEAGERWCAEHHVETLRLHVFGFNTAAIGLYESAGFAVTNLNMMKRIPPS